MDSDATAVGRARSRGRPPSCPRAVLRKVIALREDKELSLSAISAALNAEGVPTPAGSGPWTKSHVDRLLHTQYAMREMSRAATAHDDEPE